MNRRFVGSAHDRVSDHLRLSVHLVAAIGDGPDSRQGLRPARLVLALPRTGMWAAGTLDLGLRGELTDSGGFRQTIDIELEFAPP